MKLICPECRHENETARIYCHECGARLDRSKVAKAEQAEDPKETQRRLRSLLDAKGARMRYRLMQGTKFLLGAILVAALVQLLRPPELQKKAEGTGELSSQINLVLEDAAMGPPGGAALQFSEEQVNAYVANRSRSKRKALSSYLQFEGVALGLDEGYARATVERSLFGFSVFTTTIFAPRVAGTKVVGHVDGGRIGRLPIHPMLMPYCGFFYNDALGVFDREIKSIAQLGGIELHAQAVTIRPKPAAAAAVAVPAPAAVP